MAATSSSNSGAANPQGVQLAMEEIKMAHKLAALPDPSRRSTGVSYNDDAREPTVMNLGFSFCEADLGRRIWR